MELRTIQYFMALARERNVTRAAESLHISQPALSRQLKQLEDTIGHQLFLRGSRYITLTDEGEYFLAKCKEIMSLVDTTLSNLQDTAVLSGDLNLGAGETHHIKHLFQAFKILKATNPHIRLNIRSANADDLFQAIDSGLIDFALTIGFIDQQKYHCLHLPWQDRWGVLIHHSHPLADSSSIKLADLKEEPLIISNQNYVDSELGRWLGEDFDKKQMIASYNLLYNASILAKEEVGLVLGLDGIINTQGSDLSFIPLEPPLTSKLSLIWKKDQRLSNVAQAFLDQVRQLVELAGK